MRSSPNKMRSGLPLNDLTHYTFHLHSLYMTHPSVFQTPEGSCMRKGHIVTPKEVGLLPKTISCNVRSISAVERWTVSYNSKVRCPQSAFEKWMPYKFCRKRSQESLRIDKVPPASYDLPDLAVFCSILCLVWHTVILKKKNLDPPNWNIRVREGP